MNDFVDYVVIRNRCWMNDVVVCNCCWMNDVVDKLSVVCERLCCLVFVVEEQLLVERTLLLVILR